ncbi:MAG: dockerin type I repeat-containing protein [Bacilli bacterium]|jgi:hypothetical protein|nr:dockerin type I repeat-containing protein [Bacilli bacterium]
MKKSLNYIAIFVITMLLGISIAKAEDYNFDIKVYKTNNVNTFLNDYKNGNIKELEKGSTLNAGDTIAVSLYINSKNSTASGIEARLNWDKYVLEPVLNSNGISYGEVDLRTEDNGGIYQLDTDASNPWDNNFAGEKNYYMGNIPRVSGYLYNIKTNHKISKSGSIAFLYFKIKENVVDNTILTFSYNKAEAFSNYGRAGVSTSVSSIYFKIRANLAEPYSLMGDINGNGKIDYGDVQLIINYVGRAVSFNEKERSVADVTGDGNINLTDQIKLMNMYNALDKN